MKETKELTRAELQVMNLLWDKAEATVNELLSEYPDPKPAYNTVSTVLRVLSAKGFAGHKSAGHIHRYFPLISREIYTDGFLTNVKRNLFKDSFAAMASFFVRKENLSNDEIEELIGLLQDSRRKEEK